MPAPTGRSNNLQNIQHYAITDNPVFKIKVRTLATDLEQTANKSSAKKGDKNDPSSKFKIGDVISGTSRKNDKSVEGKVVKVNKDSSTLVVVDKDGEKIVLDASSCKKVNKDDPKGSYDVPYTSESKLLSLSEFLENMGD